MVVVVIWKATSWFSDDYTIIVIYRCDTYLSQAIERFLSNLWSIICFNNKRIDRTLDFTSDAPTDACKHVTSNSACACSQRNKKDFSLLIGTDNVVRHNVKEFSSICWTKRHFRWSDQRVVDTSNWRYLTQWEVRNCMYILHIFGV